jgi:hypothetical protein
MTRRLTAALMTSLVVCAAVCLAADETLSGYDAWRFGMTTGEVAQIKELGPYSPVPATGGLETKNGRFLGEKTNISFIFGPHGLRRIQIWVYEGHDTEAAIKAFYSTYKHLEDHFGVLQQDGAPCPAGLALEAFRQRIPASYSDKSHVLTTDQLKAQGSISAQVERLQLRPQRSPAEASVSARFLHSPQLGSYWVFLFYDAPSGSDR